ncbi:hypothetical protein ACHQM5_009318 [Ranunculus cassubicifolius]
MAMYQQAGGPVPPYQQSPKPGMEVTGPVEWSTGLCDCCDDPSNCCMTCCCPCITFGRIAEVVDRGTTTCGIAGVIYYALSTVGCACLYSMSYRTKLRGLYSLNDAPCGDFFVHCFCESCALCQEYRELKIRGTDPLIGWQGNVEQWNRAGAAAAVPPSVAPGMTR